MAEVAAIILAAGRGARFDAGPGESKMTALLDGKPLVRHAAEAALGSRARPVVLVLGHAADRVAAAVAGLPLTTVRNPDYATGLAGSLQAGLLALPPEVGGAIAMLGDMPRVTSRVLDRLIEAFDTALTPPDAVVPTNAGRDGNPVLLGRALFAAVGGLSGDEGARRLLGAPGRRVVRCAVEEAGIGLDVDTRDSLTRLGEAAACTARTGAN